MKLTMAEIITATAQEFGVSAQDITGPSMQATFVRPRFAACAIARDAGFSLPQIGIRMGGRDHTTIMNACTRAAQLVGKDADFCTSYHTLRNSLLAQTPALDPWQFTSIRRPQ